MSDKTYGLSETAAMEQMSAPDLAYKPRDPQSYTPNIGLIGCGGITQTHLTAYKAAGYHVVALCDTNQENARARQEEFYSEAQLYSDYHALLQRSDIEVVDIAAHPIQRVSLIEDALRARKHVLSQKPFVLDLDFGARMADLADEMGVKLAVNQNGRWAPHFSYVRAAIGAGLLGEVLGAHLSVHWDHSWAAEGRFADVHDLVLYDFGIHWFDIVTAFMGGQQASRVFASKAYAPHQQAKPPLLAQVLIEYPNAQATLAFDAAVKFGPQDRSYIAGTQGTIQSIGPSLSDQTVTIFTADGQATPALEGSWFPDGFHGSMSELLCAIEDGREPSNGARENLNSLALAFAAIASSHDGQPKVPGQVRKLPS